LVNQKDNSIFEALKMWYKINDWPGYEINNKGVVRRGRRIHRGWPDKNGYIRVHLSRFDGMLRRTITKQIPIHTLACITFHGPRPTPNHTVAHGRRGKLVNTRGNLRWALPIEQAADRKLHGNGNEGERHPFAKLTWKQVAEIRSRYKRCDLENGASALAREFGVSRHSTFRIVHNLGWIER
jgi:hypothetical protein